jgi:hypothetical protein
MPELHRSAAKHIQPNCTIQEIYTVNFPAFHSKLNPASTTHIKVHSAVVRARLLERPLQLKKLSAAARFAGCSTTAADHRTILPAAWRIVKLALQIAMEY